MSLNEAVEIRCRLLPIEPNDLYSIAEILRVFWTLSHKHSLRLVSLFVTELAEIHSFLLCTVFPPNFLARSLELDCVLNSITMILEATG